MNSLVPKLTFTVQIFKGGKQYVSFNPELRVASCGVSAEKAKKISAMPFEGLFYLPTKKGTFANILEEV